MLQLCKGVWCNGNIRVSKTFAEGSIPSTPVERGNLYGRFI